MTDADGLDAETFESAHTLERSWDVSFISLPAFANVASWLSTAELIAQSNGRFAIRKRTFAPANLSDRFGSIVAFQSDQQAPHWKTGLSYWAKF